MTTTEVNANIRDLMREGYGTIVLQNPRGKHSLGVGILNKLNLIIEGSCGYFGVGLIDGPNVRITGRVGWSCGENMMAGTVVIEKNAGSTFGAAMRGGDLVCKGSVGSRTGIDQKGGTIIVGGDTGALSGFMMQRGRMVVCGNAGKNLGDSMYDGTIYAGGDIRSLGVDAVEAELTDLDKKWLTRKLKQYGLMPDKGRRPLHQDRRRQAALELRQPRADREETHPVVRAGYAAPLREHAGRTAHRSETKGTTTWLTVICPRKNSWSAIPYRLGDSFIFPPRVMDDIHIKAELGRYRMRASRSSRRSRTGTT